MNASYPSRAISLLILVPMALTAQVTREHDPVPLKNWPAPLYWQPAPGEMETSLRPPSALTPLATTTNLPLGSSALVFVAMTPCRVMDTRAGQGFPGAFGPPSVAGGLPVRTIPIQSSTTCSIPSLAQAYSFNVTVVPPGALIYLTLYPATANPQPAPPNASTLNAPNGGIVANAAIVPAGTDGQGSVDVYASNPTDLIIDINGYYATPGDLLGNTALGIGALASNTTGANNTASGDNALANNTTGAANTAVGFGALRNNSTGNNNTASGDGALLNNTTGGANTASGASALAGNTTGSNNTATGASALSVNTIGSSNTASGYQALQFNTTGSGNTASGINALQNNTTGGNNTASGAGALAGNTTGSANTASGQQALRNNSTGSANTANGQQALQNNTTGANNTASGVNTLLNNTTGGDNTASGSGALQNNTIGFQNTAVGLSALLNNTTGTGNTGVGLSAMSNNTTGSSNIAIGQHSAQNVSSGNGNNIHVGSQGASGDSGTIRIGTPGTQTSFFVAGIRGVTTGNNDAIPVVIDSNGQLGTVSSSRRFKEDIQDMGEASSGLLRLRPVTFRYRQPFADGSKPIEYGLIAEEVAEVYPDLVAHSADRQVESVKYQVLDSMLLNEVQKQAEEIRLLKDRLAAIEALLPKAPAADRR